MFIPINELLKNCRHPKQIKPLLKEAEEAIKNWDSTWSSFIEASVREELISLIEPLSDISCISSGGYQGAERQRIYFQRSSDLASTSKLKIPISGLSIEGNFLFDNATVKDFQLAIENLGVNSKSIGDLWLTRDRGAQLICTNEAQSYLNKRHGFIRNVDFICKAELITNLQTPHKRIPKKINTVEASTRLDAIASAGFSMSRAKIVENIREGRLRLNWKQIRMSSKNLEVGDKVQLENKGTIEILTIAKTKKDRWRVELLRQ